MPHTTMPRRKLSERNSIANLRGRSSQTSQTRSKRQKTAKKSDHEDHEDVGKENVRLHTPIWTLRGGKTSLGKFNGNERHAIEVSLQHCQEKLQ